MQDLWYKKISIYFFKKKQSLGSKTQKGGAGLNEIINKLPFEAHIPGYNFCGPGTKLDKRLNADDTWKPTSKPINQLDRGCYYHDLAYRDNMNDLAARHRADEKLQKVAKDVSNSKSAGFKERAAAKVVQIAMSGKRRFGLGSKSSTKF